MASDDVKINIKVEPILDKRATSNLIRDIKNLEKNFGGIEKDYTKIAKQASSSVAQINRMAKDTALFQKELSKAAKSSIDGLKDLGDKLQVLRKESADLESAYASEQDEGKKAHIRKSYDAISKSIDHVQKSYKTQKKNTKSYESEIKRSITNARKNSQALKEFGDYTKKDAIKSLGSGLKTMISGGKTNFISGLKDVFSSVGKGAAGIRVRAAERAPGGTSGAGMIGMLGMLPKLAGVASIATGAISAVSAVYSVIDKASKHIADMNKALLEGSTIAGDWSMTGDQYTGMLKDFRSATIDARSGLVQFGVTSEDTLRTIAKFSEQSSGSLSKTIGLLSHMGGTSFSSNIELFQKNALVFGKSIGMETQEVAGFMGNLISEIGYGADNVTKTMDLIVKQAATTNMPITKFMDVFKSAIPNIDLFTNRLEQLTGTIKLLARNMSPKFVQEFMDTMGRGFDQMDFKQRLKMAFVIGPKKVNTMLQKDFTESGKVIGKQFSGLGKGAEQLGSQVEAALKAADPIKAMARVTARASALGASGAVVQNAQSLARNMASAKRGGPTQTATAMRGAGVLTRMNLLQEYAGKMTGGDLSGLGEHVAKQLGVSESEYKSILALNDSMEKYQAEVNAYGKTTSKSLNKQLSVLLGTKNDSELAEKLNSMDSKELQATLLNAGALQISEQEKAKQSMEDKVVAQYNATTSISDKIDNIIGFWLEKIYGSLGDIIGTITDLINKGTGGLSGEARKKREGIATRATETSAGRLGKVTPEMKTQYSFISGVIKRAMGQKDIISAASPLLNKTSALGDGKKSSEEARNIARGLGISSKTNEGGNVMNLLQGAISGGNGADAEKILRGYLKKLQDTGGNEEEIARILSNLNLTLTRQGVIIGGSSAGFSHTNKKYDTVDDIDQSVKSVEQARAAARATAGTGAGTTLPMISSPDDLISIQENQTEVLKNTEKSQEDGNKIQDEMMSKLQTGVPGIWDNKYKNVIKDASKEAFSSSLSDYLTIQTRMASDAGFKSYMEKHPNVLTGTGMHNVATTPTVDLNKLPEYDRGGPVDYTKVAKIHGGEYVVPRGGVLVRDGGTSGKNVTINGVSIHVTTGADPKQIAEAIHNLYRSM